MPRSFPLLSLASAACFALAGCDAQPKSASNEDAPSKLASKGGSAAPRVSPRTTPAASPSGKPSPSAAPSAQPSPTPTPEPSPTPEPGPERPITKEGAVKRFPGIRVFVKESRIEVDGYVNLNECPTLEFMGCTTRGKTHESLLRFECEPKQLHLSLIMLGLVPTPQVSEQGERIELDKGEKVVVEVAWFAKHTPKHDESAPPPKDGVTRRRVEDLIYDRAKKGAMPRVGWVFTGSRMIKVPRPPDWEKLEEVYAASFEGNLAATFHHPHVILDTPLLEGGDDTIYVPYTARVPERGTPVTIHIRPWTKADGPMLPKGPKKPADTLSDSKPGDKPADGKPVDKPADGKPGDKPADGKPSDDEPADEPDDEPDEDEPDDMPSEDEPDDEPKGDEPSGDEPKGDNPSGDEPKGDEPSGDEAKGDEPSGDEAKGDEPSGDTPSGGGPKGDESSEGEPAGEAPAPEREPGAPRSR